MEKELNKIESERNRIEDDRLEDEINTKDTNKTRMGGHPQKPRRVENC